MSRIRWRMGDVPTDRPVMGRGWNYHKRKFGSAERIYWRDEEQGWVCAATNTVCTAPPDQWREATP